MTALFQVPSILSDFESAPYNLQPYPSSFLVDGSPAERAASFDDLLSVLEADNKALKRVKRGEEVKEMWLLNGGEDKEEKFAVYEDSEGRNRVQALYTLVRLVESLSIC